MYPYLSQIFDDLFGIELPFPIYSFGALVATAVLTAAWLTRRELDRMHRQGRIGSVRVPARDARGKKTKGVVEASPGVLMGTITVLAVVGGFAGAKIFHILENFEEFLINPSMLIASGGFTFYGGFLVAAAAIWYFVKKRGVAPMAVADAVGPGLLLAYGIGRIGCYLAGDGDWGVCSALENKPGWIPARLWSEPFPNNILGIDLVAQCGPPYDGVYPTMLYEFAMAAVLFAVMWAVRRHPFRNGWLFALYLVFAGVERLLIEQIRVNNVGTLLGLEVTQAEVISVVLILVGLGGLAYCSTKRRVDAAPPAPQTATPA